MIAFDFTYLQTCQANSEVEQFLRRRRALGDDLEVRRRDHAEVARLHQQAAVDAAHLDAAVARRERPGDEQAHVFLLGADFTRFRLDRRRDDHFDELALDDRRRRRGIERPVERDDAAERRGGVGAVRAVVRCADRGRDGDAAGIRVLDDHAGGRVELPHAFERGIGVGQVVEREFLALQLRGRADARALRVARDVERGLLVRVLAVAQVEPLAELQRQQVGEVGRGRAAVAAGAHGLRQVRGDHRVVLRRVRVRLRREAQARGIAHAAVVALHLGEHRAVVERIDHDGDAVVVLGRGAHHRRPADVDVLDGVLEGAAGLGDGRGERIQVDDDEVDRLDAVLAHHGVVGAAPAEQAAVDLRVQGLDPAVHDLREAGDRRHVDRVDAVAAQQPGRAAGRE